MPAYRFCRTDDMPLLVEAWNRCRGAWSPGGPPVDLTRLKRWIRELDLWCSSCMVASDDTGTIGVVLGCKREHATLILDVVVHSDHARRGHGRHLLTSLRQKLAILGPRRILAETPADDPGAAAFFAACGFRAGVGFTDYVLDEPAAAPRSGVKILAMPVGVEDLEEEGLLRETGEPAWQRSLATIRNRRREIQGLAAASETGIEAYILVFPPRDGSAARIAALGEPEGAAGGAALDGLVAAVARRFGRLLLPRRSADDPPPERLAAWGFRPAATYVRQETEALPA